MNNSGKISSVGKVETQYVKIELPPGGFVLDCGRKLPELCVAYESYGRLNDAKDNVIFVCHALSGDAHVAGFHDDPEQTAGWWDEMVGPGKGIDTDTYHVVCANILGGCKGTTGPSSVNPATGRPYGGDFPPVTVGDIVRAHALLLKKLGIERLAAVIGGSFGGLQVLEWCISFPGMVDRGVCIAAATALSTQALAFDIVGRKAITSDSNWRGGNYYGTGREPVSGLAQARMIGHITYLSPEMMTQKFGRGRRGKAEDFGRADKKDAGEFCSDFEVERYLDHQGEKFVRRFDANSYLHITKAMDEYDLVEKFGDIEKAFENIDAKLLVVALSEDWLFPPEQSLELGNGLLRAGKKISYCRLHAPHGHDAFLVDIDNLAEVLRAFLPWVGKCPVEAKAGVIARENDRYGEFGRIAAMIRRDSRVIDIGCGDGFLLDYLAAKAGIYGMGIDVDLRHVISVIDRGFDIFQVDIDEGLSMIPDNAYDYAIIRETLQVVKKPRFVLQEMLRIAEECIIVFPNFGQIMRRLHILFRGKMPKGGALPYEWYETPNIHLFTLRDFIDLCRMDGIRIKETVCISDGLGGVLLEKLGFKNLGADRVLLRIVKNK